MLVHRAVATLAAACLPGIASAQGPTAERTQALAAPTAPPATRIMLTVLRPTDSLAAPLPPPGHTQAPANVSPGAALVGSIVATLMIRGINEHSEAGIRQFATALDRAVSQIDLQRELAQAMQRELQGSAGLDNAIVEEVQDAMDSEQPGLLVRISEPRIYTFDLRFQFAANYTLLQAVCTVRLWHKDAVKPVYSTRVQHASPVPEGEGEAKSRWVADKGAPLLVALRQGIAETARLFVADSAQRAAPLH